MTSNSNSFSDCPIFLKDFLFYMLTIKGRSVRTVEAYHVDLRLFLRYIKAKQSTAVMDDFSQLDITDFNPEHLSKVTTSDVYSYLNYILTDRSNGAATRSRKVSSIRSLFKYLTTRTQYLNENPVKDLEVPTIRKTVPKYLTLEESLELLTHVDSPYPERDQCILTLFLNCGMRLSELVGINLNDIRDNTLKLLGKGNKERIIYLNEACVQAIESYLKVRPQPKGDANRLALFLSSRGTRLSGRRVEQIVEQALKNADLNDKGYSPHKLRHTAATLMYQHGNVDIRVLKEILGHANLSTTEIYTHISNKQLEKAADASPLSKVKLSSKHHNKSIK